MLEDFRLPKLGLDMKILHIQNHSNGFKIEKKNRNKVRALGKKKFSKGKSFIQQKVTK